MKKLIALLLLCLILLLTCQAIAKVKKPAQRVKKAMPKVTALVCSFDAGDKERKPWIDVIGGPVSGKGWISSEKAKGLLHKGNSGLNPFYERDS